MSVIELEVAKRRLRIVESEDDPNLQQALDGAEQEACRYMNRDQLPTLPQDFPSQSSSEDVPSSQDPVVADVVEGVLLIVRANYDADTAEEIEKYRAAAETKLHPYRVGLGI